MTLRIVTSFTGLHSKRCPGIGFLPRADREIGVFQHVAPPTRLSLEFPRETGLILRCTGKVGIPSRQSRGIDPPVEIRRREWAEMKWCPEPRCSSRVRLVCWGTFWVASRVPSTVLNSRLNVGLLLRRCSGKGLHLAMTGEPRGFSRVVAGFSSFDGELRMPLVLAQGSPIFHSSCEGELGIALESLQGK